MKCDSVDGVWTLLGGGTCLLPTAGLPALLGSDLRLTTALRGDPEVRRGKAGAAWASGLSSPHCPTPAVVSQTFVASGAVPAFPGLGVSLLLQFWAKAKFWALLFLWWAGGVVSSSLERISHQRDRDRSRGVGQRTGSM